MRRGITKLFALGIIISLSLSFPSFAAGAAVTEAMKKQAAIDAVTGPATGKSNTGDINTEAAKETSAAEQKAVDGTHINETLLGNFKVTGYCNCTKCTNGSNITASGTVPKAGHTVGTDWKAIPKGSRIRIGDSPTVYTVEDTGAGGNVVDIFYSTHKEALDNEVRYLDIYLIPEDAKQ